MDWYTVGFTYTLLLALILQGRGLMNMSKNYAGLFLQLGNIPTYNDWLRIVKISRLIMNFWILTTFLYTGTVVWHFLSRGE